MKRITPLIYESLTPKQRVVACIEALARRDETERLRLVESCPKVTYHQTDVRFSEAIENLMGLSMAVDADLKELLLSFVILVGIESNSSNECLQKFANLREAWGMTLNSIGIDRETMAAAGPPISPAFELFEDIFPSPETERAEAISSEILKGLELGTASF